jgi:ABC-type amino acid transport substrate-binding protein
MYLKKINKIFLFSICLSLSLVGATLQQKAEPKQQFITLAFAKGKKVENNIAAIRVLNEAYQQIGIKVNIKELPGKRALVMSNGGKIDGELHRISGISVKYPNLIEVPIPIVKVPQMAFSKKNITVNGWESLRLYNMVFPLGYLLAEKNTKGMDRAFVSEWSQSFLMVDKGRADITISNKYRGLYIVNKLNIHDVHPIEPPLEYTSLHHYLHKKNVKLLPKITAVLSKMKQSGRIDNILLEVEQEFKAKRASAQ